jgi:hypothetical protein
VAGLQQQIESLFTFQGCIHHSLILAWGMIFMRVYKHWLDYDAAALAFLIVGIAAVGLLAIII